MGTVYRWPYAVTKVIDGKGQLSQVTLHQCKNQREAHPRTADLVLDEYLSVGILPKWGDMLVTKLVQGNNEAWTPFSGGTELSEMCRPLLAQYQAVKDALCIKFDGLSERECQYVRRSFIEGLSDQAALERQIAHWRAARELT